MITPMTPYRPLHHTAPQSPSLAKGALSRFVKLIFSALLFLGLLPLCAAGGDYELHVKHLAAGTPEKDIKAALQAFDTAGLAAFPTLLAHFSNTTPAEPRFFQRDEVLLVDGQFAGLSTPRIGDACFDILQSQVEGNWPKAYRTYYVLSPSNAKQWLEDHRGLTLPQLQRASRAESLRRAEAALANDPSSASRQQDVAFLRQELEALK